MATPRWGADLEKFVLDNSDGVVYGCAIEGGRCTHAGGWRLNGWSHPSVTALAPAARSNGERRSTQRVAVSVMEMQISQYSLND
jgi:hypothetical protein